MKKILLVFLTFLLGSSAFKAAAQSCNTAYLGTKSLYEAPDHKSPSAPKSYSAVFINHVGRHGARHLTKEVNTAFAFKFLGHADSAGTLTADGRKLWEMVRRLEKIEHGKVKSISEEGANELKGIAGRMYADYPSVFQKPVRLDVAYTKEVRTQQSMDAFLSGLKSLIADSIGIHKYQDDIDLRFYDLSPAYKAFEEKGPWEASMEDLRKDVKLESLQQRIAARWIMPDMLQKMKMEETDRLISDVFGFATIVHSLGFEIKQAGYSPSEVDFTTLFTCEELTALGKIDNADDYYKKGPGVDNNGIQVRIAAPLLANFIRTTDAFITKPEFNANLRFAHAETIAPFAALLNMEPADKATVKGTGFDKNWKASAIVPLSSNITWVLYSDRAKHYLIQFLLNERPVHITGLKSAHGYYYNWADARRFYLAKLKSMGVNLGTDMQRYLSEIK